MRLRLTVQRHSLPPIRLLWNAPATTAPQGAGLTISQFLENVNDIVQLEADEWGLDDYAVEVHGFECLHYSELHQILKEDDEVCVRPLQTADVRARRISGRIQITEDGKHLVDGVPFGRALLRRPSRPAIHLPPRKRQRLTYTDDDYDVNEGQAVDRQIALKSGQTHARGLDSQQNEEEDIDGDDYFGSEDDGGLADDEVQALQDELEKDMGAEAAASTSIFSRRRTRSSNVPAGLGLLRLVDEHGATFPGRYENPLLDRYSGQSPQREGSLLQVRKRGQPQGERSSREAVGANRRGASVTSEPRPRCDSSGSNKTVRFEEAGPETPATVRQSEASEEEDDDDDDFETDEVDESDKENAPPRSNDEDADTEASESSSATFSEFEASDVEDTSSAGTSEDTLSSDSTSESEPEERSSKSGSALEADSVSSSDPSSSASSTSDSESDSEAGHSPKRTSISPDTSPDDKPSQKPQETHIVKAPGTGMKSTKKRNERRRDSQALKRLKAKGTLPPDASPADMRRMRESQRKRSSAARGEELAIDRTPEEKLNELEAKRQALLKSIDSGGIDVSERLLVEAPAPSQQEDRSVNLEEDNVFSHPNSASDKTAQAAETPGIEAPKSPFVQVKDSLEQPEIIPAVDAPQNQARARSEQPNEKVEPTKSPNAIDYAKTEGASPAGGSARRSKLDLEGSRRLLFGSLGLKTPRSREDKSKLQAKLIKDVNPVKEPQVRSEPVESNQHDDVEDESWRDTIDLQAVECCYEGIELSTPPFPFVQRWDPQQKRGYDRPRILKRKEKKRKRNNTSYYEDQYDDSFNYDENKSTRREGYTPVETDARFDASAMEARPNIQQGAEGSTGDYQNAQAASEQLMRETRDNANETQLVPEEDDLPAVPENLSTCPPLTKDICKPGAIVAFKKFEMELGDQWHPYISEHRTALVEALHDNGVVDMTYAKRDLPQSHRRYDSETGERIYGKFEMPGYESDEDDGTADASKVSIDFGELIEPIVIQAAENSPKRVNGGEGSEAEAQNCSEKQTEDQTEAQATDPASGSCQARIAEERQDDGERRLVVVSVGTSEVPAQNNSGDDEEEMIDTSQLQPNTQTSQDISQVIRDAGWHSSIDPAIKRQLELPKHAMSPIEDESNDITKPDAPLSAMFNSFSSPPQSDHGESSPFQPPITSTQLFRLDSQIADSAPREVDDTTSGLKTDEASVEYPCLPHVEEDSEYFPSQSQRQHRSVSFAEEDTIQSTPRPIGPPALRHQQSRVSDPSPQPSRVSVAEGENAKGSQSFTFYDCGADSNSDSDELPTLFSQRFENRLSQEIEVKRETSQGSLPSPARKRKGPPKTKTTTTTTTPSRSSQPPNARLSSPLHTPFRKSSTPTQGQVLDDGSRSWLSKPTLSQRPPAATQESEIVDLTISGDPIEHDTPYDADESYRPSSSMPGGSGWVRKTEAKKKKKVEKIRRMIRPGVN